MPSDRDHQMNVPWNKIRDHQITIHLSYFKSCLHIFLKKTLNISDYDLLYPHLRPAGPTTV